MKTIDCKVEETFWKLALDTEDYKERTIVLSCRDKITLSGISV